MTPNSMVRLVIKPQKAIHDGARDAIPRPALHVHLHPSTRFEPLASTPFAPQYSFAQDFLVWHSLPAKPGLHVQPHPSTRLEPLASTPFAPQKSFAHAFFWSHLSPSKPAMHIQLHPSTWLLFGVSCPFVQVSATLHGFLALHCLPMKPAGQSHEHPLCKFEPLRRVPPLAQKPDAHGFGFVHSWPW